MDQPRGLLVRNAFFERVEGRDGEWKCKCGVVRKQIGTGYTNLTSHVRQKHPEDLLRLQNSNQTGQPSSTSDSAPVTVWFSKTTWQVWGWMDLVVKGLLPFSVTENEVYRKHIRYAPISRPTLSKYLSQMTTRVEQKIAKLLPSKFAIVFDGWSAGDTHYIACYASYPSESKNGFTTSLLGFSPLDEELGQSAAHHRSYIEFVLELFDKQLENIVAIIGDNCSCNKALADILGCPLIGCASHRYNLCVKDMIQDSTTVIDKVQAVMKKLRYPIPAATLRQHTHLRAKCHNVTRWSSTASMLHRFQKIKEFIPELGIEEVIDIMPTSREQRTIERLTAQFVDFDSVTKSLQRDDISLAEVRTLFDGMIDAYPGTKSRLSPTASIVHSPIFESGLVKIQNNQAGNLSDAEQHATRALKTTSKQSESAADGEIVSFAQRLLKRRRTEAVECGYLDTRFLSPTSNICERLFSKAGYALSDRRKKISPVSFEQQLFLHANSDLWDVSEVHSMLK